MRRFKLASQSMLRVRRREESTDSGTVCQDNVEINNTETAVVICDMWDKHWCTGATERIHVLARKIEAFVEIARAASIAIIHAPSDTMGFYKYYPERQRVARLTRLAPPQQVRKDSPPLPVDDSDEGCDTIDDKPVSVWTRENLAISIKEDDVISDNGEEIYSFLRAYGMNNLLFTGVHVNKCILDRSFGIKQMSAWGVSCILLRDLTDAIYNPRLWPWVSTDEATRLVVEYIEKYWCPSALATDIAKSLETRSAI